jgi:uncharacterized protein (DUF849 family)
MGCANGILGSMKNLSFMKETMDYPCPGSTCSCFGVGDSSMKMLYGAAALGGHIRVEIEDNVLYAEGQLAAITVSFSSGQFVSSESTAMRSPPLKPVRFRVCANELGPLLFLLQLP